MPATSAINQVGKKPDISDIIAVADMKNTPFATMLPKNRQAKAVSFSSMADAYDDAKTTGAVDGQDVKEFEDAGKHRGLIEGRVQQFERTAMVTTQAEAVAGAGGIAGGIKSEFARAKAKKAIEFKRDQEKSYCGTQDSRADDGKNGSLTRGACKWISSTAQGDQPVPAQFRTPADQIYTAAIGAFSEDDLRTLLQKRYEKVGLPSGVLTALVGTEVKNKVTDFSRYVESKEGQSNVRFYQTTELTKIRSTVDVYEGDYGDVEFHLDNFLPNQRTGLILDLDFWAQYSLKNPAWKDLPDLGGGPRALLQGILGLLCENPLGQCQIAAAA